MNLICFMMFSICEKSIIQSSSGMSTHPLNLAIRFFLEVTALVTFGLSGCRLADNWTRIIWAIALPLIFATIWGVFAVRNDPSRSGKTVVPTPGIVRLLIELALFSVAIWMIIDLGYTLAGWIFGAIIFLHYLISYERIIWLLKQK
jgi:hypothetical protein